MAEFDLVVRGGEIADGRGGSLQAGDVGVKDGRVAAVGKNLGRGAEEIDAKGKLVTPGFVDIHTHYDGQASWDECLAPSSWHGVTTAVMGNCGVGFAPVKSGDRERLIELMEGVEDIPGAALHEGLDWSWESFGEYLNVLDKRPHDIDFCAQLPHGALRIYVMGERGAKLEESTPEDRARMRELAAEAMRAGAIGFSSSRTQLHNTAKGEPIPSLRASEEELAAIAMGLADAGSGVLEFVSDFSFPRYSEQIAMFRRIMETSGRPLSLSLAQSKRAPEHYKRMLSDLADANAAGLKMTGQIAPRGMGFLYGLQSSAHPFVYYPSFEAIEKKPLAEKLRIMRDPAFRAKLLAEGGSVPMRLSVMPGYDRVFRVGDPMNFEPSEKDSVQAQAQALGRDPADLMYDWLLEDEGRNFFFAPFNNYVYCNLDACRDMIAHPNTVIGLGDGGAHVGYISDGSFPTTVLAHWGRDRTKDRFDLGFLVKRQTQDTARAVGLNDRGVLGPGMKGDLNVIDMDKLAVERPSMAFDLPAGGKRLMQKARGYDATIVSGRIVYRNGQDTGARAGKLVRMGRAR